MSEIKVDFGQLSQAANDLESSSKKIEGKLDELENLLKPLVAHWEGEAQQAYRSAQAEWDQAAKNMQEIAAKMGMAVTTANEAYQGGEKRNAGRFSG